MSYYSKSTLGYYKMPVTIIILVITAISLISIGASWWNQIEENRAMPVREWISSTENCRDLLNYVIGDPTMDQVKQFYNGGGITWNMADEKLDKLIAMGGC